MWCVGRLVERFYLAAVCGGAIIGGGLGWVAAGGGLWRVGFLPGGGQDVRRLAMHGEWAGEAIATICLLFYWVGYKADTGYAGFLAAQIVIAGLIVLLGGWAAFLFVPILIGWWILCTGGFVATLMYLRKRDGFGGCPD